MLRLFKKAHAGTVVHTLFENGVSTAAHLRHVMFHNRMCALARPKIRHSQMHRIPDPFSISLK